MLTDVDIGDLLQKGGVYPDITGTKVQDVFHSLSQTVSLPASVDASVLYTALCEREKVLTTAVGNGVAMPHPQKHLFTNPEEERISVCYLKTPIDMNAPDGRLVHTMLVLQTSSVQTHLKVISKLASLLQKDEFKRALENHSDITELITLVHTL